MKYFEDRTRMSYIAHLHTNFASKAFSSEIKKAIEKTVIYDKTPSCPKDEDSGVNISIVKSTHQDIIKSSIIREEIDSGKIVCVHNFASYKSAGGLFLVGSTAQEESLCHNSALYNVLRKFEDKYYHKNRNELNRGLYRNIALYSPGIPFWSNNVDVNIARNESILVDVLTCASPNASIMQRFRLFNQNENFIALKSRIEFIWKILGNRKVDTFITGAFGCGVFKQDPVLVADIMMSIIDKNRTYPSRVIFAIPDDDNYQDFLKVISFRMKK